MKWHKERRDATTKVVHTSPKEVVVLVKPKAYMKVNTIVDLADKEVGWMEEVTRDVIKNKVILTIHDIHILEQTVTGATFDFTDDAWLKFADSFGNNFDELEAVNERLRGCGHSHVNMGVFQSTADEDMTKLFSQNGICKWFLVSRANKKGDRQFDYSDAEAGLLYMDVPWIVDHAYNSYEEFIKSELATKVVKLPSKPYKWHGSNYCYDDYLTPNYNKQWWRDEFDKDVNVWGKATPIEDKYIEPKAYVMVDIPDATWEWDEVNKGWIDADGNLWRRNIENTLTYMVPDEDLASNV